MSNPRLVAEDIARDFVEKRNPHLTHAKNIRKYLRRPVLAVTRRILLPRLDYDDDSLAQIIGNAGFGDKSSVDPTFLKGREGLDWRDYVTVDLSVARSKDIETDLSFSETEEAETENERQKKAAAANPVHQRHMKLTRRSLARMEAFLASTAYALPNDAVSSVVRKKDPIKSVVPNLKAFASFFPIKIGAFREKKQPAATKYASSNESSIANGLAGLDVNDGVATAKASSRIKNKPGSDKNRTYPQMHIDDLTLRLELYIRTLRRVYSSLHPKVTNEEQTPPTTYAPEKKPSTDECVIHLEPTRAMKTRMKFVITSLISTVGSVGSMTSIISNLLVHFTREQLAVELLSDDLQTYIRKICLEYEHLTSFASLAFLSTPEDSAQTQLVPLLLKYVEYLQTEREKIVWECRLESTLARAIDPNMRKMFKTSEFRSIGHLLDACHDYRHPLENIVVAARDSLFTEAYLEKSSDGMHGSEKLFSGGIFDKNTVDLCNNQKQSNRL